MKIKYLFNSFRPEYKCGSAIAGAMFGGSLVNSVVGYYQNERNRERNIDAQNEAAQTNRDWQTVEAEKARQFSAEQQQKAMDFNSPVYQANELAKTGLIPALTNSLA